MRFRHVFGVAAALALVCEIAAADIVTEWNSTAVDVGRQLELGPNRATRLIAIAHLAVYDAVVSVTRTHEPYLGYVSGPHGPVSLEAAVAQAAHDVLLLNQPGFALHLDDKLATSLAAIADGLAKTNGIALGRQAATNIVFARLADGSAVPQTYDPPANPGAGSWVPTPLKPPTTGAPEPAGLPAAQPEWRALQPFGIQSPDAFRAPAPPALTDAAYTAAFDEVKALGALASTTRTAEQTRIADFWQQETHIPWNAIARTLSVRENLTLTENARLFALLNVALADSRIVAWDSKYFYGGWRPITAIRFADDGNADTITDATWAPYVETPNHPDYVSGHSATGAAGAALLAAVFGDDNDFSVESDTLAGARSFESFSAAADENAESRVYGGVHFRFANDAGLALGKEVGHYVAENLLPAVDPSGGGAGGQGGQGGQDGGGAGAVESGAGGAEAAGSGGSAGSGSGGSPSATAGTGGTTAGSGPVASGGDDAGGEPGVLAGAGGDGGASLGGTGAGGRGGGGVPEILEDDSSCSCRAVGSSAGASTFGWLSGLALAGVLLRRSRARKRR